MSPSGATTAVASHRHPIVVAEAAVTPADYLAFFEAARLRYYADCGFNYPAFEAREKLAFTLVELDLKLIAPARSGESVVAETRLVSATSSSIRFHQRLLRGDLLLVDAKLRLTCSSLDGERLAPVPARFFRDCVARGQLAPASSPGLAPADAPEPSVILADDLTRH